MTHSNRENLDFVLLLGGAWRFIKAGRDDGTSLF
jgi:hypothetical protein